MGVGGAVIPALNPGGEVPDLKCMLDLRVSLGGADGARGSMPERSLLKSVTLRAAVRPLGRANARNPPS